MDSQLAETLGLAFRRARRAQGLTQEDVAERVGISGEHYARMERGISLPGLASGLRIAVVLGVDLVAIGGDVAQRAQGVRDSAAHE